VGPTTLVYTNARQRAAVMIRFRRVLIASTLMGTQLTTERWFAMPFQRIDLNAWARKPVSVSRNAANVVAVGTHRSNLAPLGVSTRKWSQRQPQCSATYQMIWKRKSAARMTSQRQSAPCVAVATTRVLVHIVVILAKAWAPKPDTLMILGVKILVVGVVNQHQVVATKNVARPK